MVNGVQSNGVGTSLKHFALNNQETNRTSNNVIGTPRTFREIYLKPFEIVVKEAQPWTVMTSYNKVNGTMTSERSDLITEILRHEWGFKGMVMTDWYGGQHATLQMEAGNDLLMPGKLSQREELKKAVLNGHLSMEIIDRNVKHILEYILKTPRFKGYVADNNPDLKAHAVVTRNAALEGMVLLKNLKNTLPIKSNVKNVPVSYPFGYGLSYTNFKYGKPSVTTDTKGDITVKVEVKNTGKVAGKEVVQTYVSAPGKDMDKPVRELKAFAKTRKLNPGESEMITMTIPYESLASFNETASQWQVEGGQYTVMVAKNAADMKPLTSTVNIEGKVTEAVRPSLLPEQK